MGEKGWNAWPKQQPDLILLDLMMPEMDGFEFVTHLRKNSQWCKIPVVVLTAKDITGEDRIKLRLIKYKTCFKRVFTTRINYW
ncbi:MAG: response regulator [Thiotrichaceae bacterium]